MASSASGPRNSVDPAADDGDAEDEGGDVAPDAEHHPGGADQGDQPPPPLGGSGIGGRQAVDPEQHEGHREQETGRRERGR